MYYCYTGIIILMLSLLCQYYNINAILARENNLCKPTLTTIVIALKHSWKHRNK